MPTIKSVIAPLQGVRVVEVTIWYQGPIVGELLAGMGAEVIKVEPLTGEPARAAESWQRTNVLLPDKKSLLFEYSNCNKKSIALDLRKEEGKECLYRLVKNCDVFVTNILLRALKNFGCTYEVLRKYNPKIIYARAGGYGSRGPDREVRCNDTCGIARSGFMFTASPPDGSLVYPTGSISDLLSGTMLAFGVLAALLKREKDGKSQQVMASQLGAMMWLQAFNVALYCNFGTEFPPFDRTKSFNPFVNVYKCKDNKWIALGDYREDRIWVDFCKAMGREDFISAPKFSTGESRRENCEQFIASLDEIFATRTRDQWLRRFKKIGMTVAPVNRIADLPHDKDVIQNEYIIELENKMKMCRFPFDIGGINLPVGRKPAPNAGEHTEEILLNTCGYSWEDIARLKDKGVIN